jgi:hypothetical protein
MKVQFGNYSCHVVFSAYQDNDNTAIQLVDVRDGLPVATATINPGTKMKKELVAIKDYSENEGMLEALTNAGIVSAPISWLPMGFVTVPVCELLVPVFEEFEEQLEV